MFLMRTGISFTVSASDQKRLERIIKNPNSPQKHVWRARIILLTAEGLGTAAASQARPDGPKPPQTKRLSFGPTLHPMGHTPSAMS